MNINSINKILTVINKVFIVSNKIKKTMVKVNENQLEKQVSNTKPKRKYINKRQTKIKDF